MVLAITREPIDPAQAYSRIASERAGSVVFHYAVVKEQSGASGVTSCIDYAATAEVELELAAIASELQDEWALEDLLLIRRVGRLGVGEIISLIAASSPNSEDAFSACRDGIRRLKKMSTIVKQERFAVV